MSYRIALIILLSYACQAQAVIRVGVSEQPRELLDFVEGSFVGALSEFYQCPLDKSGLEYEVEALPHARVLLNLQRGDIDVGLPLVRVNHRDEYAVFTRPLKQIKFVLYTRKDIDLSSDLSRYSFAAMRATASVDLVAERNARVVEVGSWIQALQLTKLERYDGVVIPAVIAQSMGEESFVGLNRIEFGTFPMSLYVSRAIEDSELIVDRLNAAITACQAN